MSTGICGETECAKHGVRLQVTKHIKTHGASASFINTKKETEETHSIIFWGPLTDMFHVYLLVLARHRDPIVHLMLPRNRKVHATRHAKIAATLHLTTCNKNSHSQGLSSLFSGRRKAIQPFWIDLLTDHIRSIGPTVSQKTYHESGP